MSKVKKFKPLTQKQFNIEGGVNMRDMQDILKLNLVAEEMAVVALSYFKAFHKELHEDTVHLYHMMEWAEKFFSAAAKHAFYSAMSEYCMNLYNHRANDIAYREEMGEAWADTSIKELREIAKDRFRPRGRHHSTSASSNNAAAHLDEVVLDFIFDRTFGESWYWNARNRDPESRAWYNAKQEEGARVAAAKAEADAAAAKVKEAARGRVRNTVSKGGEPERSDVLLGWPTATEASSIRNDKLFAAVSKIHRAVEQTTAKHA